MNLKILYFIIFFVASFTLIGQELTAMTYNIRLDLASDKENSWSHRKDFLSNQVLFLEPDVLGVQEALPHQVEDLNRALSNYNFIGWGRDGGKAGEHSGIYYKTDKLVLESKHTFWLSETPDQVSLGWDAAYNRVCTYGLFRLRDSQQRIWIFNTHLDHVGSMAQTKGLSLILSVITTVNTENLPVILMGDFNLEPDAPALQEVQNILTDARDSADLIFGPEGTFNAFKYNSPVTRRIDYIMVSEQIKVSKYGVLSSNIDFRYPSDHFPIFVQLKLK